jgi:shikimate 5-dehydrogenase
MRGRSMNFRSFLYKLARLLGDVNAVKRGRVGRRIGRRTAGRGLGRLLRDLFR